MDQDNSRAANANAPTAPSRRIASSDGLGELRDESRVECPTTDIDTALAESPLKRFFLATHFRNPCRRKSGNYEDLRGIYSANSGCYWNCP